MDDRLILPRKARTSVGVGESMALTTGALSFHFDSLSTYCVSVHGVFTMPYHRRSLDSSDEPSFAVEDDDNQPLLPGMHSVLNFLHGR